MYGTVIQAYIYSLFQGLFHDRLLRNVGQSSLHSAVSPCRLPVSQTVVCMFSSQTPDVPAPPLVTVRFLPSLGTSFLVRTGQRLRVGLLGPLLVRSGGWLRIWMFAAKRKQLACRCCPSAVKGPPLPHPPRTLTQCPDDVGLCSTFLDVEVIEVLILTITFFTSRNSFFSTLLFASIVLSLSLFRLSVLISFCMPASTAFAASHSGRFISLREDTACLPWLGGILRELR